MHLCPELLPIVQGFSKWSTRTPRGSPIDRRGSATRFTLENYDVDDLSRFYNVQAKYINDHFF